MGKTNTTIGQTQMLIQKKEILQKQGFKILKLIFLYVVGFMMGRAAIYNNMNPMAVAYFAAVYTDKKSRIWMFLSVIIGLFTAMPIIDALKYALIMILIVSINSILDIKGKKLSLIHEGVIAATSCLIITITAGIIQHNVANNILIALLEGAFIFSLVLIYGRGLKYLFDDEENKKATNEILISEAIIMGTAVAGIADITILGLGFIEIWIFSVVLILGYRHGIGTGAIIGVISGIVLVLMGRYDAEIIGIFGMVGILSALFRELGKVGSIIGFSLGTIGLWYFISPLNLDFQIVKALIVSVGIFAILPNEKEQIYSMKKTSIEEDKYIDKVQGIISEKLNSFSNSFQNVGKTFEHISERRGNLTTEEVNKLLDDVAEKVCKDCSMCKMCWQKEFYDTYRTVFSIFSAVENKNHITEEDIPDVFIKKCIKPKEFITTTNRLFELYKINLTWENKIAENRQLISQQFYSVSDIIDKLGNNLYKNIEFNTDLETKISEELKKDNITVKNVVVYKAPNQRMEVSMKIKYSGKKTRCMKDITPVINKFTKKKMRLVEGCKYINESKYCEVKFIESEVYRIAKGVARVSKDYTDVSGDSYTFLNLPKGQDIVALSDGMGTGLKAFKESKSAIELLEQLLEAGFDGETAIKMINSILVLKSSEQTFSTLDMTLVDRYTGMCEFVKIGAASSFIKTGNKVEVVKSTSLPLGMLNDVESESTTKRLNNGDMIIMVTDGILDSEDEEIDKEKWVEDSLHKLDSRNPQDMADYILESAREKTGGKLKDDMTVLVMRIWEKAG
ncbi:stage II sporulation protein E [Vallitalea longa]|uniref:Stage II sporulation protein E n=1 Tax=Vallitalea longa TaxID=2936439 RepID=A0A9W5YDV3_9FIRM|nr:stage II sporulation protein E [Vallitalea longa]GKX30533.1 stage II sporulation protein E [Vallitalea longa]